MNSKIKKYDRIQQAMNSIIKNFETVSITSLFDIGSDHQPLLVKLDFHSKDTTKKGTKLYHKLDIIKVLKNHQHSQHKS